MTTPLVQLLSTSWSFSQKHLKAIIVGALVFGAVFALAQRAVVEQIENQAETIVKSVGMDPGRMDELSKRMAEGDQAAMKEMMEGLAAASKQFEGMSEKEIAAYMQGQTLSFIKGILPIIGLAFVVFLIVSVLASVYYLVLAVENIKEPVEIAGKVPRLVLPMLGVWIWMFIRSFAWIPIIGPIFAIILCPRFLLAPVILIKEKKGVLESVSLSYTATRGYWAKIVGNFIVLGVLLLVLLVILSMLVGMLGVVSLSVAFWAQSFLQQCATAFGTIFMVKLSLTIMEQRRT